MQDEFITNMNDLKSSLLNIAGILEKLAELLASDPALKKMQGETKQENVKEIPIGYSVNQIRDLLKAAAKNGHKGEIITILKSFGVERISQLPESSYLKVIEIVKQQKFVKENTITEILG